jgi:glutathione S-transferase
MTIVLHGYRYSVYVRIVRMTLAEKGVIYDYVEVNPFGNEVPAEYIAMHPFKRVPTLVHNDFVLYETAAITRYIDESFEGASLQPTGSRSRARMAQIISVIDAYGYWPMVRQVFSHRVFRPHIGEQAHEDEIRSGVGSSHRTAAALEALAESGGFLVGNQLSLADLHLAPMMAYFTAAPEGQEVLDRHPKLSAWWELMRRRRSLAATDPGLPKPVNDRS